MTAIRLLVSMVSLVGIGFISPVASLSQGVDDYEIRVNGQFLEYHNLHDEEHSFKTKLSDAFLEFHGLAEELGHWDFKIRLSHENPEFNESAPSLDPSPGERSWDHSLTGSRTGLQERHATMGNHWHDESFGLAEWERHALTRRDMVQDRSWADSPRYGEEQPLQADWRSVIPRDGAAHSFWNDPVLDDGQVHRSIPLLGVVGGVGAVGIKGLAVAIPAKLRPLLAGGAFGTATGYGLSKVFDTDYGWRNAIIDFGVGAATGPAVVALGRAFFKLARIPKATKIPDDVVYEPLPEWLLGETSRAGDITINSSLKGTRKALETYQHELVHQALTPSPGSLFATQRQDLMMWGYHNSHFLKWFEESLAEGIAQKGLIKGVTFPIKNGYAITKSRAVVEGIGVITILVVPQALETILPTSCTKIRTSCRPFD